MRPSRKSCGVPSSARPVSIGHLGVQPKRQRVSEVKWVLMSTRRVAKFVGWSSGNGLSLGSLDNRPRDARAPTAWAKASEIRRLHGGPAEVAKRLGSVEGVFIGS